MIILPPDEVQLLGFMIGCRYRPGHGDEPISEYCLQSCRVLWLFSNGYSVRDVMEYASADWPTIKSCLRSYHERKYPIVELEH